MCKYSAYIEMQRVSGVGVLFQKCMRHEWRIQAYKDVLTASFGIRPQHLVRTMLVAEDLPIFIYCQRNVWHLS
jgi:hypothetical protein